MSSPGMPMFYLRGVATLVIVVCFFLPWIRITSLPMDLVQNTVSALVTGKAEKGLINISGAELPRLANDGSTGLTLKVLQIFWPRMRELDHRAWFIWSVPGGSLALLYLGHWLRKRKNTDITLAIIYGSAGGWAYTRLNQTLFQAFIFKVELCQPFLVIMWTWLCMSLLHLLLHLGSRRSKS